MTNLHVVVKRWTCHHCMRRCIHTCQRQEMVYASKAEASLHCFAVLCMALQLLAPLFDGLLVHELLDPAVPSRAHWVTKRAVTFWCTALAALLIDAKAVPLCTVQRLCQLQVLLCFP